MEYGVFDGHGKMLCCTAGFEMARAETRIPMTGGNLLMICGDEAGRLRQELDEARAANQAKEAFLSNMSHDIRTPMNAIVGMTALAKKHMDERTRLLDALGKIETASAHLLSLINDVLDMSRISSGRMHISRERFFLSDLLHDILTIANPLMEEKGHMFSLKTGEAAYEVCFGDPLRLRQIFVNIISNAVKYTPQGGRIELYVSVTKDKQLIFVCKDNGIGMSRDFLTRIFEPFERVQTSTVSKIEGTGLGMSIVKKTVDALSGDIQIDSEPGKGTCVTLNIPLETEENEVQIDTRAIQGTRFLILEADADLEARYREYLTQGNVMFTCKPSVQEGLDALSEASFENRPYGAVIIGNRVRNATSALDIADYLKKAHPELKVYLASEDDWTQIEYQATRCGIVRFIPVPFFRKSLLSALIESEQSQENNGDSNYPDLTGRRILLVEDNLINQEIAKEILSVTHAEIDLAENGKEAVEAFRNNGDYCLILMDVQMPVMDGYEACRAIRAENAGTHRVPIYAMTANTFAEDIQKAKDSGMDGHLAKPIDITALMQVLRNLK